MNEGKLFFFVDNVPHFAASPIGGNNLGDSLLMITSLVVENEAELEPETIWNCYYSCTNQMYTNAATRVYHA